LVTKLARQHLLRAQARMKYQADKNQTERVFQVGDKVYLKLQLYVQSSVATLSNQKLAFKFFGPYIVLQRIGDVAYKLQLPDSSNVHPVFHVSQLKTVLSREHKLIPQLPYDANIFHIPIQILQSCMV
jgi:hypothetical protein